MIITFIFLFIFTALYDFSGLSLTYLILSPKTYMG